MSDPIDKSSRAAYNLDGNGMPRRVKTFTGGARTYAEEDDDERQYQEEDVEEEEEQEEEEEEPRRTSARAPMNQTRKSPTPVSHNIPAPTTYSKAPMSPRQQSPQPSARAPMNAPRGAVESVPSKTAKANGQVARGVVQDDAVDIGVTPDESNIYSGELLLEWNMKVSELISNRHDAGAVLEVNPDRLADVFKVYVKNPDKKIGNPSAYVIDKDVDLTQVHINKVNCRMVKNSSPSISAAIQVENEQLARLLNKCNVGSNKHVMLVIPPGANQIFQGKEGYNLIDNTDVLKSGTYRTFGHINIDRLHRDVVFDEADQVAQVIFDSQLAKMIKDNIDELRVAVPKWDGSIPRGDKGYKLPAQVVVESMCQFNSNLFPLLRGVFNAKQSIKFELVPTKVETWDKLVVPRSTLETELYVAVVLEFEYSFPKSALGKYAKAAAKPVTVREQFYQGLRDKGIQIAN
jgi:hypothetical protein